MKRSRLALLAAPVALALACGGSGGSSAFDDAAPSYQALSLDLTTGAAATALDGSASAALAVDLGTAALGTDCHPHLFVRTEQLVHRVNRHVWKALRHAEAVIARNPTLVTGATQVWERVIGAYDVKFTMTRTTDVLFTWKLELKKVGDAGDFATVMTGSIDRTGAAGPHQGAGELSVDLGALAAVTGEDVAGTLSAQFEAFADHRTLVVDAKDVVWDADSRFELARAPRSAHYVYFREPGKGGSLKLQDEMVFGCPANPGLLPADVKLVSRWYRTASGSVHGRSDATMEHGQLASGQHVAGLTCHQSAAEGAEPAEGYWLMKLEDASNATIAGAAAGAGETACDIEFGPVPNVGDASEDFSMGSVDFTTPAPYPFPGMSP